MTAMVSDDFERNWMWLGLDKFERLAVFQSFGDAGLPVSLQTSLEDALLVDDYIASELISGPILCEGKLSKAHQRHGWRVKFPSDKYSKNWEVYLAGAVSSASRGLYVYDPDQSVGRPKGYYQVAFPAKPLLLTMIPASVRDIVSRTRFVSHSFDDLDQISPEVLATG